MPAIGQLGGAGHELEARRQFGDLVAVAHPHVEHAMAFGVGVVLDAVQQPGVAVRTHIGIAEFARRGRLRPCRPAARAMVCMP